MTRGVPRINDRSWAIVRDRLSCSGEAQRLKSSSFTSLGPVRTTISGQSTMAGTVTGPNATTSVDAAVAGGAVTLSV